MYNYDITSNNKRHVFMFIQLVFEKKKAMVLRFAKTHTIIEQ